MRRLLLVLVLELLLAPAAHAAPATTGSASAVDSSTVKATGSTTRRKLADRFGEVSNVRDFGAKGDGITDDTAAFQAAVDAGKPVFVPSLPPGKSYYVRGPIRLPVKPATVAMFGRNSDFGVGSDTPTTEIVTDGESLFLPATLSTYGALSQVTLSMSGLAFRSSSLTTVAFDRIAFYASRISDCHFMRFKRIVYGSWNGVSIFGPANHVIGMQGPIFSMVATNPVAPVPPEAVATVFTPSIGGAITDSSISGNYLSGAGYVATPDFALLDLQAAGTAFVTDNFIDFADTAIHIGPGGSAVTVANNTIDIVRLGVSLDYGVDTVSIVGNRFFHLQNSQKSYFTHPTAAMNTGLWTAVYFLQKVKSVTIVGNTWKYCDRFIALVGKWYKDLHESGNRGDGTLVKPVVDLTQRTIDEAGYVAAGESGDGTGFSFESMELKTRADFPDPVTSSYEGHNFRIAGVLVQTHGSDFYDAGGTLFSARPNLAPAADFSVGWTSSPPGFAIAGGTVTCDGSRVGWVSGTALGTPLQPGTYLVSLTIASRTGAPFTTFAEAGFLLDNGATITAPDGQADYGAVGLHSYAITVPVGRTVTNLSVRLSGIGAEPPFVGSLSGFTVRKFTGF